MLKDIIVHLDGSEADEIRIRHTEALASATSAHVTGLLTVPLVDIAGLMPMDGGAAAAEIVAQLDEDERRNGDRAFQRLSERFGRLGVPNAIRRIEGLPGEVARIVAREARCSDLFAVSRPARRGEIDDAIVEAALFDGGHAIYVVPPGHAPSASTQRILIAWSDTRESARAVDQALPFIERAARTRIVLVDPETDGQAAPAAELARHLARHGAQIEIEVLASEGRRVSDTILDAAKRMAADLVVLGGFGHSRTREWLLGGVTGDMLEGADIPFLMAH